MKSSRQHIAESMAADISKSLKTMTCEHKWKEHAFGYICTAGCGYYTGMSDVLNNMIKVELKGRKKK